MNLHEYTRILTRLTNVPVAMSEEKWSIITNNVTANLLQGIPLAKGEPTNRTSLETTNTSLPIINVFDTLVSKSSAGDSGFTSYQSIRNQAMSLIKAGNEKIGFYFSTPGGEVAGVDSLAEFLYSIYPTYGVKTFGFTDDMSASAGQWLMATMQKTYATPFATVASIGVITTLVDRTEADTKDGIKFEILRSKSEKALNNPHEKISAELVAETKKKLDIIDTLFNNSIIKYRPQVSMQSILDLKGKAIFAQDAIKLGLVDQLVTGLDEVLALEFPKKVSSYSGTKSTIFLSKGGNMDLEQAKSRISELEASISSASANTALAVKAERMRCAEILKAGTTFGMSLEIISARMAKDVSVEDATEYFTDLKAERDKALPLPQSTGIASTQIPRELLTPQTQNTENLLSCGLSIKDLLSLK